MDAGRSGWRDRTRSPHNGGAPGRYAFPLLEHRGVPRNARAYRAVLAVCRGRTDVRGEREHLCAAPAPDEVGADADEGDRAVASNTAAGLTHPVAVQIAYNARNSLVIGLIGVTLL